MIDRYVQDMLKENDVSCFCLNMKWERIVWNKKCKDKIIIMIERGYISY